MSALARHSWLTETCSHQAEWREEVKQHFEKIKSEGTCLHRLDEELINRRREELRSLSLFFFLHLYPITLCHLRAHTHCTKLAVSSGCW